MWRKMTCLYGKAGSCSKTTVVPKYSFIHKFSLRGQQLPGLIKTAVHNVFFNITAFLLGQTGKISHCAPKTQPLIPTLVKFQLN
jgi:hypothetical protein